jgi:phosphohistidine phosphatase
MKMLLIMRHAKSSWDDTGLHDHDRPLNKRGKLNAPRMGRLLRELDLAPDLILTSSARRARDTAEAVADQSGYIGDIKVEEELYAAPPEVYLEALASAEDRNECILIIGHNPGLEELLEMLTGEQESLPTAAIARVDLPIASWQALADETPGKLVKVWRPKELP